jgi:hypothetical protein
VDDIRRGEHISSDVNPKDRIPRERRPPHHTRFHLVGLKDTGTALEGPIKAPFLQRKLNPLKRFPKRLKKPPASLYILHGKPGSVTVSITISLRLNVYQLIPLHVAL